VIRHVSTPLNS